MPRNDNPTENPLESLHALACHSPRDWGSMGPEDAWLFGVICGWDETMEEMARHYDWTTADAERLKRLHKTFEALRKQIEQDEEQ